MLSFILGVVLVAVALLPALIYHVINKTKAQKQYDRLYSLSDKDIRRIRFWKEHPQFLPSDMHNYIEFNAERHPDRPMVNLRLRNEFSTVQGLVVEPWGESDEFPVGANYHLVLALMTDRLPGSITFPDQIICSPDWVENKTPIGEFELRDNLLILHAQNFIWSVAVFTEDGTGTMIPG